MRDPAAIQRGGLRQYLRWAGGGGAGATNFEAPGVTAAIVPATPRRSIPNSVTYDDAAALAAAYDDLAETYERHGISSWTVWTPEFDWAAIDLLTGRGHVFDGSPAAMTLDLERFEPPDLGDLDWDADATFEEAGRINDQAYGHATDGYAQAFTTAPDDLPLRGFRARREGETACVLTTIDDQDDLGVYFVATSPAHGRQGLAGRLLAAALVDARERGLRTSSLQASGMGEPVYTRLGYEIDFRLHLYERRR